MSVIAVVNERVRRWWKVVGIVGLGACSGEGSPVAAKETESRSGALVVSAGPVSADPGRGFACGLGAAGELYCWGTHALGQLGVGGAVSGQTATPTRVGTGTWSSVSTGDAHACGITAGALYCWGGNARGQLGDGSATNRATPVRVGAASDWTQVSAGTLHTCGRRGASAYCWGANSSGQLGTGNTGDQLTPAAVSGTWAQVAAGGAHSCAIATDGAASCWGSNASGQLGVAGGDRTSPISAGAGVYTRIDAGGAHTCAVRSDGTLWCTGANGGGQLGDGTTINRAALTRAGPAADWSTIATGPTHSCGLSTSGDLRCFGSNTAGEAGLGSATSASSPTSIFAGTVFTSVSVGAGTCASGASGAHCFGPNRTGELGANLTLRRLSMTEVAVGHRGMVSDAAMGLEHGCLVRTDGTLWCSGGNGNGQLGLGDQRSRASFTRVGALSDWQAVSAGEYHTCAVRADGRASCWGNNQYGQVGDGSNTLRSAPVELTGLWDRVVAGRNHTCGLRLSDRAMFCWGINGVGRLGDGTTLDRNAPVRAGSAVGYTAIALGEGHSCGLLPSGGVDCFGYGQLGALGGGRWSSSSVPVRSFEGAVAIAAGASTTCAIDAVGTLRCWGLSDQFQAGTGEWATPWPFTPYGGGTWSQIAASTFHTCGVRDGSVACFGSNSGGQLGDGGFNNQIVPVTAGNFAASRLMLGFAQSCAIRSDGTLMCAGSGLDGQFGDARLFVSTAWPASCGSGASGCAGNALCADETSGAVCTCGPGMVGDGLASGSGCVVGMGSDPCATDNGGCAAEAVCTMTGPGARSCACGAGYAGDGVTCADVDECLAANGGCSADAACTNTAGGRTCACNAGYSGDGVTCSDIDECLTANGGCSADAACTNTAGSRSCACNAGFTGDGVTCSDIDECLTANGGCSADAACTNTPGSRTCACNAGYTGDGVSCADIDECLTANGGCSADAACTNTAGGRTCACNAGYTGDGVTCSDVDECLTANGGCSADAACTNTPGSRTCACNAGYTGDGVTCSDVDECLTANGGCSADAACTNTAGGRTCACNAGYSGDGVTCADTNECLTANGGCAAGATCTNTVGSRTCACNPGYAGDGLTCTITDPCLAAGMICPTNGYCWESIAGPNFACLCLPGYDDIDGDNVCTDIDECLTNNGGCAADAVCTNTVGGRTCACNPGFTGDGTFCIDDDECLVANGGCSADAACTNTPGGRTCACNAGYTGDGVACTDVNECLNGNGGCATQASCTNTPGGRTCACNAGYSGDGVTCADTDECLVSNGGCSVNAACTNVPGGRTCVCSAGYTGDGETCADVDECLVSNGGCSANATCTNTVGGRTCACAAGYAGDGVTCADVNECLTANGGCSPRATCTNTAGGRSCACNPGSVGDGILCEELEADLALVAVSAGWSPIPDALDAVATVCNDGDVDVEAWVSWRLSTDEVIDAADLEVQEDGLLLVPAQDCIVHSVRVTVAPALGLTGSFTVGGIVRDVAGVDADLTDNTRAGGLISFGADLTLVSLEPLAGPMPAELLGVRAEVCNLGNQPGQGTLSLRLSSDDVIDAGDPAGDQLFVSLDRAQCYDAYELFAVLPSLGVSGVLTVGVLLTPDQPESVTTNHTLVLPAPLAVSGDLAVTAIGLLPGPLPPELVGAQATVCNLGNLPASGVVSLRLSSDGVIDAGDVLAAQQPVFLNAGECWTDFPLVGDLPGLGVTGTFTLGVLVTPDQPELVSTNDALAFTAPLPVYADLAVTAIGPWPGPLPPELLGARATVCNLGNLPASGVVSLRLSSDGVIGAGDVLAAQQPVFLNAGECWTDVPLVGDLPGLGVTGTFTLGVLVTPDQPELVSTNDALAFAAPLPVYADLAVTAIGPWPGPLPPELLGARATVCNLGNLPASGVVSLRLSSDGVIDAGDVLADQQAVFLDPGACWTDVPLVGELPGLGVTGTFTVGALVAPDQPELVSSNDALALPAPLVVSGDLAVTAIGPLPGPLPPDLVGAYATVCNLGNLPATGEVSLRFSEDALIDESDVAAGFQVYVDLGPDTCGDFYIEAFLGDPMLSALNGTYRLGVLVTPLGIDANAANDSLLVVGGSVVMPPPPCVLNNGGCSGDATCTEVNGTPSCACNSGFTGDGLTCADVNECLTNNGGCAATGGVCTNTIGSRTCACAAGYTGNGLTCTAGASAIASISSLSPTTIEGGTTGATLDIAGSDFLAGATVTFSTGTGSCSVLSASLISCTAIDTVVASAGPRTVTVRNVSSAASAPATLTVTSPVPIIFSMTPDRADATSGNIGVTIVGNSFSSGTRVAIDGVQAPPLSFTPTRLFFNLNVGTSAIGRTVAVAVVNPTPGGGTSTPVTFTIDPLDTSPDVLAGQRHTCRISAAGTVQCAGYNALGQLGDSSNVTRAAPVDVFGLNDAVALAAGDVHTCALRTNGLVSCWGSNQFGQLGEGTNTQSWVPVQVAGITSAVEVSCGYASCCARMADGTLRCWGYNSSGQLGNGTTTNSSLPVQVSGISDAVELESGYQHVCVRHADNGVSCWGLGTSGQLGRGSATNASTPGRVGSLTNVIQLSSGAHHTCARQPSGSLWCWGRNNVRQLGDGTTTSRLTPLLVTTAAGSVATGFSYTCVVSGSGGVRCTGGAVGPSPLMGNGSGQGSATYTSVSIDDVRRVMTGGIDHICAELRDGSVVCWGTNANGVMGIGTSGDVWTSPVLTPF